jgi:hypothetical protein
MKSAAALFLLLATMAGSLAILSVGGPRDSRRDFKIGVWYDVVVNQSGLSSEAAKLENGFN